MPISRTLPIPAAASAAAAFSAVLLAACASPKPVTGINPDWRMVPEATVLHEKRQFFLYGRKLDSVTLTVPPSVELAKGALNNGDRVLSIHLKVSPLPKDSLAPGETVGTREVRVKTVDTTVVFTLKIVDEALPR